MTKYESEFVTTYGWAQDFINAYYERPRLYRWIMRLLMGRYAYREFVGMKKSAFAFMPNNTLPGYCLEESDYHKDPCPWSET